MKQETYLTITPEDYGVVMQEARRLTEEEKENGGFSDWFKELGFYSILGTDVVLPGVSWKDMPQRPDDGCFYGSNIRVWIISRKERDAYLALNEKGLAKKAKEKRKKELEFLKKELERMKRQVKLCETEKEARQKEAAWNNRHNDGFEGFVPHYYTVEEYENTIARIRELEAQAD